MALPGLPEVLGDLAGELLAAVARPPLEALGDRQVQPPARRFAQRLVERLAQPRLGDRVERAAGLLVPLDEARLLQAGEQLVDRLRRRASRSASSSRRNGSPSTAATSSASRSTSGSAASCWRSSSSAPPGAEARRESAGNEGFHSPPRKRSTRSSIRCRRSSATRPGTPADWACTQSVSAGGSSSLPRQAPTSCAASPRPSGASDRRTSSSARASRSCSRAARGTGRRAATTRARAPPSSRARKPTSSRVSAPAWCRSSSSSTIGPSRAPPRSSVAAISR